MVGWHHRLDGLEFEQAPGDGEGQGGLGCCSPWGRKESDVTEQLNNNLTMYNDKRKSKAPSPPNTRGEDRASVAGRGACLLKEAE